ncbi:MAG: helix-turn-helix domain-containing protein [Reyranella sp.]|uniref:helix-turn-helix domain-containing protein n=1 Tax=Reyranella sp. TaxID=1929291 RepID=UPI003D0A259B
MVRAALPPEAYDDGITVAEAARVLGVDVTKIRRMVDGKAIEGWRVGAGPSPRSIRVSLASCLDYREANSAGTNPRRAPPPKDRPAQARASFLEAQAYLRSRGMRV